MKGVKGPLCAPLGTAGGVQLQETQTVSRRREVPKRWAPSETARLPAPPLRPELANPSNITRHLPSSAFVTD